ncbi:MAG: permease prefix domain 1-containing protein [Candidatus Brocadiaceae bacterium]|jgi:hypothetical protein
MKDEIEEYVEAITRRLSPDPELHWDVSRELRSHLEDAAQEMRERGMNDEESVQMALRHFGNQEEVAEGIWRANRGRMRLRAAAKWAARLTLVPAALVLALLILHVPQRLLSGLTLGQPHRAFATEPPAGLTDEERFVFEHLRFPSEVTGEHVEAARVLRERYPRDPVYHTHYIRLLLDEGRHEQAGAGRAPSRALEALRRAEEVDRDNAFHDYVRAALLWEAGTETVPGDGPDSSAPAAEGEEAPLYVERLSVIDENLFQEGLREFLEGAAKTRYEPHTHDAVLRKAELAGQPKTFPDQMALVSVVAGHALPDLRYVRSLARRLPGAALLLLERGRQDGAREVADQMVMPALHLGANADTLIEMMVAKGGLDVTLRAAPSLYEELGLSEEAARAEALYESEQRLWESLKVGDRPQEARRRHGVLTSLIAELPFGFSDPIVVPALRHIEHLWAQSGALALVALGSAIGLVGLCALVGYYVWRHGSEEVGARLYFVGWRRMGGIALAGVVLPLALYWAYTRLAPFSSMRHGLRHCTGRVALELAILLCCGAGIVMALSYRAIRARCRDAGIEVPPPGVFNPFSSRGGRLVLGVLLVGLLACFVAWAAGILGAVGGLVGAGILLLAFLGYVGVQFWRLKRAPERHFRMTFIRSLVPVVAVCFLIGGLTAHLLLTLGEHAQIRRLNRPGHRLFFDELEMTSLAGYREHMAALKEAWSEAGGPPAPSEDRETGSVAREREGQ